MSMESENAQDAAGFCEITFYDLLQVGNPAFAPVIDVLIVEQFHSDEYSDWRGEILRFQLGVDRLDDSAIVFVSRVVL